MMRRRSNPLLFVLVAFAVFAGALWQQRAEEAQPAHAKTRAHKWAKVQEAVPAAEREQLLVTLALIDKGGPYPFEKDGSVFSNRETLLPVQPRGYYREYTVVAPGAKNRGARRVVQGKGGETWYTSDHYRTFVRID